MLKAAKVVGLNSDQEAALTLVRQNPQTKGESSWDLFILVTASLDDAFTLTRQALSEAESLFYASFLPLTERLNECLNKIKELLQSQNVEVLLAASKFDGARGRIFYFLNFGQHLEAYLARENNLTSLLSLGSSGQLISGILNPKDRIILTTQNLKETLGEDFSRLVLLPMETIEEEILGCLTLSSVGPQAMIVLEEEAAEVEKKANLSLIRAVWLKGFLGKIYRLIASSRKNLLFFFFFLIMILAGGFFSFNRRYSQTKEENLWKDYLQKINNNLEQASNLKDSDQNSALDNLRQAEQFLTSAGNLRPKDLQINELRRKLTEEKMEVLKIYSVDDLPLWLDLNLVKDGFSADQLSFSEGKILLLDPGNKTLLIVDSQTKAAQILAGAEKLGQAKMASLGNTGAFVYSEDKGIVRVNLGSNQLSIAVKPDSEWEKIEEISTFAGNIYLLDTKKGLIWKYLPTEAGYSEKRNYFSQELKINLSDIQKITIDSSVWLLKKDGTIFKFTQGESDSFSLKGWEEKIQDPQSFFLSDQTDNLYILDRSMAKLLVFDKKGQYLSQYQSDKLNSFSDFGVDEKNKKAYLLSGSKIYEMELK